MGGKKKTNLIETYSMWTKFFTIMNILKELTGDNITTQLRAGWHIKEHSEKPKKRALGIKNLKAELKIWKVQQKTWKRKNKNSSEVKPQDNEMEKLILNE